MGYLKSKDLQTDESIDLFYEDYGSGQPVVLIHGWPLSHEMWEYQIQFLVDSGYRVIAYDRRGFGKSSKPWYGYDYDTLTDDLAELLQVLNLQDVVLVGFSMGGGEVVRYFSRHGGDRVSKIALIGAVTPYLLKTIDNPTGVERAVFEEMYTSVKEDRISFLDTFGRQFFGVNLLNKPLSTSLLEYYRMLASLASPKATLECIRSFSETDFRNDLSAVTVPTLIIHGDEDKIVPIDVSGKMTASLISDNRFVVYEGAPHGLFYTHKEQLNIDLAAFIGERISASVH